MSSVLVDKKYVHGKQGTALKSSTPMVQTIVRFYQGGKVQTSSGDVWRVKRNTGKGPRYRVVR